ncbi:peroxidasin homolog [Xenopus laevis]|uniref:Peroxidasin homolog n=1 Tax=Xenopus laevis TaxID=8355 RepID=A0A8J1LAV5_XENLA|nr:peroxidasin homolog [Xenopus laevis]
MLKMEPQRCFTSISLLILLAALVHCSTQNKLQIIPRREQMYLGETQTFLCKAGSEGSMKWLDDKNEEIENEDGRYETKKIDENTVSIAVTADSRQQKVIKCHMEYESGETEKTQLTLKIIERPQFVGDLEKQKTFSAGNSVQLPCQAKGIPLPKISWIRNGEKVSSSQGHISVSTNGSLHINNIQLADAGVYTCRAWIEERTEEVFKHVSVIVNAPPTAWFQDSALNVNSKSVANLTCFVTGHPQPKVTWTRGSDPVTHDGEKYVLSANGQELSILQLDKSDEGEYTCSALNTFGHSSSTLILKVIEAQTVSKGVVIGVVLLIILVLLLIIDLTCYRTKRRGFLMFLSGKVLRNQIPRVKLEENEKKASADKSYVVKISRVEA